MRLTRFVIESVERKESVAELLKFGDWEKKHPEKRKEFHYTIFGDDGKTYLYHSWKTPVRLVRGQIIRCFSSEVNFSKEDGRFKIEYHSLYKGPFLTKYIFEKAIQDYIGRSQKRIAADQEEIERLEKLKATSPEVA